MKFITLILLLAMIFCHIINDYCLQGGLASAKQKSWWESALPRSKHSKDYRMALIKHAFSWTFTINIPIIVLILREDVHINIYLFITMFVANWIIHAVVDDLKANYNKINLVQDQMFHFAQIILTWFIYTLFI